MTDIERCQNENRELREMLQAYLVDQLRIQQDKDEETEEKLKHIKEVPCNPHKNSLTSLWYSIIGKFK